MSTVVSAVLKGNYVVNKNAAPNSPYPLARGPLTAFVGDLPTAL